MAVPTHDPDQILPFMDKEYRKNQLDKFLNGNKEQFLSEFFSGTDETTGDFYNGNYHDITSIEVLSEKPEGTDWVIEFRIHFGDIKIIQSYLLHCRPKGRTTLYGLEGVRG